MSVDFSTVGRALASPARSTMLGLLLEGRALTASELARSANVKPSTASGHLVELAGAGLVTVTSTGRHRYYRLASSEVAIALESLARVCPSVPIRSLRLSRQAQRLSLARTCYDHLAGTVAVEILATATKQRWLVADGAEYVLTEQGRSRFDELGVATAAARPGRRVFARACLDWTERRPHLAGLLGASIATALVARRWFTPRPQGRGLDITATGRDGLATMFGIVIGVGALAPNQIPDPPVVR